MLFITCHPKRNEQHPLGDEDTRFAYGHFALNVFVFSSYLATGHECGA
jgi:hypothetical protein